MMPAARRALLAMALLGAVPAGGADYLWSTPDGTPRQWAGPGITYHPDRGPLGRLDNAAARTSLRQAFAVWAAVATSTLREFREGPQLERDVTAANFEAVYSNCDDGVSAVIFDSDGGIIDDLFGAGGSNRILGVGFPNCIDGGGRIVQGTIVLNGRFLDGIDAPGNGELTPERFQNVIVHEIGHFLNLAHTQAGLAAAFDNAPTNDALVPMMFPIIVRPAPAVLQLDDLAAISHLYGTDAFRAGSGQIAGRVFASGAQFAGANVVARRIGDPEGTVVAAASGGRFDADDGPPSLRGFYLVPGLPPGQYTLEVEQLARFYSILPFPAPTLPGPREFWNGDREAATNPPDDPDDLEPIAIAAGDRLEGVDLQINGGAPPPANDLCEGAAGIALPFERRLDTRLATVDRVRCPDRRTQVVANAVWYRYSARADVTLAVHAASEGYRPVIAAVTRGCGADAVACSAVGMPTLRLPLAAGESVLLAIADADFGGGGDLSVSIGAALPLPCVADCDGDGMVAIEELTVAVRIALGSAALAGCPRADASDDGLVQIDELIAAINAALTGCGAA